MAEDKKARDSKKWKFGVLCIGAVVATGALTVATGGLTAAAALPMVLDKIGWIAGIYLGAQGGVDGIEKLAKILKKESNGPSETQR